MAARGAFSQGPFLVGIAGGSGSGKTTIAASLVERLHGQVVVIQHDAYYRHSPELSFEERAAVNYDHPASLDTGLLVEHLGLLRSGTAVAKPTYDFSRHLRAEQVVTVEPAPVIVVEGILVLADPQLRAELDLRVFVDTDADIRLARRIERDVEERGRTVASIIAQYFSTVRPMHLQFVEPSKAHADIVIGGAPGSNGAETVLESIQSRAGGAEARFI
jgi:uridine kinase